MSGEANLIMEAVPSGSGLCLDLGGNSGFLRRPVEERGYRYINLDLRRYGSGEPSLIGDAHRLPFKENALDLIVSKDTLEHFLEPWVVVDEVRRVLRHRGRFIVSVPFMHPFHGDDFYRYTPLGLKHLLRDFDVVIFESPLWVFTVIGTAMGEGLRRCGLGFMQQPIRVLCGALDRCFTRRQKHPGSFAACYRIVARKSASGRNDSDARSAT